MEKMRQIEIEWPELGVTVTANLADDKNPSKCNVLWENLPIKSIQSHAFSSGDRMYFPTRIVNDVANEWVDPRSNNPVIGHWENKYWGRVPVKPGLIQANFKISFGSIDIVYGQLKEALPIAPVAYIIEEDLDKLALAGQAVWEGLMAQKGYKVIVRRKEK
jgi:hypothetical protein